MQDKIKNLIMKKKKEGKVLDENRANARSGVLSDLVDDVLDMESDKVKGIKKVTVAGSDPKAIEMGLDKAKEIVQKEEPSTESEEETEEHEEEMPSLVEHEMEEIEELAEKMSEEDIKNLISKLQSKIKA